MATRSKRYGLRIGVARVRVALPARSPRVLSVFVKTCTVIRNSLEDRCDPRGVGASRGLRGAPARGSRRRRYPAGGVRDRQTLGSRHAGSDRLAPSSQAQQPSPAAAPQQPPPGSQVRTPRAVHFRSLQPPVPPRFPHPWGRLYPAGSTSSAPWTGHPPEVAQPGRRHARFERTRTTSAHLRAAHRVGGVVPIMLGKSMLIHRRAAGKRAAAADRARRTSARAPGPSGVRRGTWPRGQRRCAARDGLDVAFNRRRRSIPPSLRHNLRWRAHH